MSFFLGLLAAAALGDERPSRAGLERDIEAVRGARVHVRLQRTPRQDERGELAAAGLELSRSPSDGMFRARLRSDADAIQLGRMGLLRSITAERPSDKLHRALRGDVEPRWAMLPDGPRRAETRRVAAYVLFHDDVPLMPDGWAAVAVNGGIVRNELQTINGLVIELPLSMVDGLAAMDEVRWLEPALPPMRELNDGARAASGAAIAFEPPYGLSGSGVTVMVYDSGIGASGHPDFGGRLSPRDDLPVRAHSTHVAGTLGGDGAVSGGLYRGMAPGVSIESYGFEQNDDGSLQEGFLYTDPGDIEDDYADAILTHGAVLATNSISTNTSINGFPCEWEGDYGVTASVIDAVIRGGLGAPIRVVWAVGNERSSGACFGVEGFPGPYHSVPPPANAKNAIAVGAVNSNDDSETVFSSFGPTDDGRIKPEIVTAGCQSGGDGGITSCDPDGEYATACGTSTAAPVVAGVIALLLEDTRLRHPTAPDLHNATIKAVLAHTARDLGQPGPDYRNGFGAVQAVEAVELLRSERVIEGSIDHGAVSTTIIDVQPGDPLLKVTLAWDDPPAEPNAARTLINDLDLRVFGPGGGEHFPWTLNPLDPAAAAVREGPDRANIIEQVLVNDPAPGAWRVEVHGFDVPDGPQPYGLCAEPDLTTCTSAGIVSFGGSSFACAGTVEVRVVDCDLDQDDTVPDTVIVALSSDTDPAGLVLELVETTPNSAAFEIAVPLGPGGLLDVADGDTLTAVYLDADDGAGGGPVIVTAEATVDCAPPVVLEVTPLALSFLNATIGVVTDEPVQVVLRYGTSCSALDRVSTAPAFLERHELFLGPLSDLTTYYYAVDVVDRAGNGATIDNGGVCFSFTTLDLIEYYVEAFSIGNDMGFRSVTFTPDGSLDFYSMCSRTIETLPVDPGQGTLLDMTDDGSLPVSLGNGRTVSLFGQTHDTLYISGNGHLTFNGPDFDYFESFPEHFSVPRIAVLFDDHDPSMLGRVTWQTLDDRIVVSWEGVPQFDEPFDHVKPSKLAPDGADAEASTVAGSFLAPPTSTFQVELFDDDRIRFSYLGLGADDGLIGLSRGGGMPDLFFESDFSAGDGCPPVPPQAFALLRQTPIDSPLLIALPAADDGLPDPPGGLTWSITELPRFTLRDGSGGPAIAAVPYELASHLVEYVPSGGFNGFDRFAFVASDGGSAPQGGSSAPQPVNILVGGLQTIYSFPLDVDPQWPREGAWTFGSPQISGGPGSAHSGSTAFGFGLSTPYGHNLPRQYLTAGPFDCTDLIGTRLRFWRWLGIESASFDRAIVEASAGGESWTPVWVHSGPTFNDSLWRFQSYDISRIADGASGVYVRFGMGPTDQNINGIGFYLDSLRIDATLPWIAPGDADGNDIIDTVDLELVLAGWGVCPRRVPCPGDVNGDGVVDVDDLIEVIIHFGDPTAPLLAGDGRARTRGVDADAAGTDDEDGDGDLGPAAVLINDGVLAPADSGGVFRVAGRYVQTSTGTLVMRPGDELVVDGIAMLAGTLELVDEIATTGGDTFVLVRARDIVGTFDEIITPRGGWRVEVVGGEVVVSVERR